MIVEEYIKLTTQIYSDTVGICMFETNFQMQA